MFQWLRDLFSSSPQEPVKREPPIVVTVTLDTGRQFTRHFEGWYGQMFMIHPKSEANYAIDSWMVSGVRHDGVHYPAHRISNVILREGPPVDTPS